MMKRLCAFAAMLLAVFSVNADLFSAEVVAEARHPGGALIQLHAVSGPCSNGALLATFTAPNGIDKVQGCYKINQNGQAVHVVWFDTDTSAVPMRAFKKPEEV